MVDEFRSLLQEAIRVDGLDSAKEQWENTRSEREQYLRKFQSIGVNPQAVEEIKQNFQTIKNGLLYPERNRNKNKGGSGWIWVLVIVVAVGAGIIGWFLYRKRKK